VLGLRVAASYERVQEELNRVLGGTFLEVDTPGGVLRAEIGRALVYPSNGRLAIGLDVSAVLPHRWLSTKGRVYLLGAPTFDADLRRLTVGDIAFARKLDNELWNVATVALEQQIIQAISEASQLDLSDQFREFETRIPHEIRKLETQSGVAVELGPLHLGGGGIHLGERDIVVDARATANVRLRLVRDPRKKPA
jgi:hypothetical protein